MSFSLTQHVGKQGTINGVTTTAADFTTGSPNLIVASVAWFTGVTADGTMSDSAGNTWTALTKHTEGTQTLANRLFYCFNPTTSSTQTFSYNGTTTAPSIQVAAFSGGGSIDAGIENGGNATVTNVINTGSVTPSQDNCLVVAGLCFTNNTSGAVSIGSSFNITDSSAFTAGVNEGGSLAYIIQTTAGATNPQWNITNNSAALVASIASFKVAGAATTTLSQPLIGANPMGAGLISGALVH